LRHKILDYFRANARLCSLEEEDVSVDDAFAIDGHWQQPIGEWAAPDVACEQGVIWQILQRCLELLPLHHARLFVMRDVLEEDTTTICKELKISDANVWTSLYRVRLRLRQCFEQNWGEA
jgi:RNA polymerase sigma-70 factor, ECF subfamily